MKKPKKQIPKFENEIQEREFWELEDSSNRIDWNKAKNASMPHLKPSTKTISLRLPESLLESIKIEANKRDVPYQSLIKTWLAEDVQSKQSR